MVTIETLSGAGIAEGLAAVARLRIGVFRDFPYLYDGSMDYEQDYLARLAAAAGSVIVVARDGEDIVGAATACPLAAEHDAFSTPLRRLGLNVAHIFYCAESVLLPDYRGMGFGHAFFDRRESAARAFGARHSAFCAVIRPEDHVSRPADYRPLDPFWRKRGYAPVENAIAQFSWKDVGDTAETTKSLQFWMREL